MSKTDTVDGPGTDGDETVEIPPRLLGLGAGVMDVVVFTVVGYVLFEDLAFGVLIGLLAGAGVALFLPYVLSGAAEGSDGSTGRQPASGPVATRRGLHRGAAGFALSAGSILMLALRLAMEDPVVGVGGGLVAAVAGYVVLSFVLPRRPAEA